MPAHLGTFVRLHLISLSQLSVCQPSKAAEQVVLSPDCSNALACQCTISVSFLIEYKRESQALLERDGTGS